MSLNIDWKPFCPVNKWTVDPNVFFADGITPAFITDETTKKDYLNASPCNLRIKFCLIMTGGMAIHTLSLTVATIYRFFHFLSLNAFWSRDEPKSIKDRTIEWLAEGARILFSPLSLLGLFATALYGLARPHDGMKLHSEMELLAYGHPLLALCMHSKPFQEVREKRLKIFTANISNTLLLGPIKTIISFFAKLTLCLSFYDFWTQRHHGIGERVSTWGARGLKILLLPFAIPVQLGAAFYTLIIFHPENTPMRKVENFFYGPAMTDKDVVPCDLRDHFFKGDGNQYNAF